MVKIIQGIAILIAATLLAGFPVGAAGTAAEAAVDYGWLSILPPMLAIAFALIFRQVIPSLVLGIWVGAWTLYGFSPSGALQATLDIGQVYALDALADEGHAAIILFSIFIGGAVAVVTRNGGMAGIVEAIIGWISNRQRAQLGTAGMGLAIFFDDYANTMVVGNTMRPVTDRMKVSREKLAYLVDSTAAPLACVAFITTWVGFMVGLIGDNISELDPTAQPYLMYLSSVQYSFYPILALFFVGLVAWSGKDFGPMLTAEAKMLETSGGDGETSEVKLDDEFVPKTGVQPQARNAIIPIGVLILGVFASLYYTGMQSITEAGEIPLDAIALRDIIGAADSYKALMWASFLGSLVAIIISVGGKTLSLEEAVEAWMGGAKAMVAACAILVLAWGLSAVTDSLGTSTYLVAFLGDDLPVALLPALVFILAAITAFSTGTSWGAMGILMPLVLPLAYTFISQDGAVDQSQIHIVYSSIACVLAGAVWGDHCSPISDTTVLSSLASGCNHIEHVRTQMPYALLVGAVALGTGTIPAAFGVPWWLCLIVGAGILYMVMRLAGVSAEDKVTERMGSTEAVSAE